MRKFIMILSLTFLMCILNAQTYFGPNYLHLNTTGNCTGDHTLLNPLITGSNPADKLIFTHVWGDPTGGHTGYMTVSHGLWWEGSTWSIFNETQADIDTNLAFNVLNANTNGVSFTHTVTSSNLIAYMTRIDNPLLNNHPEVVFFISKTRENGIYDPAHVGIYYDPFNFKWNIYNENPLDSIKYNSTYNIFIPGQGTTYFKHIASDSFYITYLDNPVLNGNPNAMIFVVHENTILPGNGGDINDEIGVWYDGVVWAIINEMETPLFTGATFNVLIAKPSVPGIRDRQDERQTLKVFPNPASDHLNVLIDRSYSSETYFLTLSAIEGRILQQRSLKGDLNGRLILDVANLETGIYVLRIETSKGSLISKVNIIR